MSSANIRAKIQKGLAKAIGKTGSASSDKIYLIKKTVTGGETPLSSATETETRLLLVNAILKSFDKSQFSGEIQTGDRMLVSDYAVPVNNGDIIQEGGTRYIIVSQDVKAPTSDTLVYISQLRVQ